MGEALAEQIKLAVTKIDTQVCVRTTKCGCNTYIYYASADVARGVKCTRRGHKTLLERAAPSSRNRMLEYIYNILIIIVSNGGKVIHKVENE